MCGICGYVAFSKVTSSEGAHVRVKAMLESLSHRGPDATCQVDTDLAVLGATRLAIRGLTDQPSQPMADAKSGVIAVCNGEIDNHRELARWLADRGRPVQQATDVAVIPGLYLELGEAFASQLVLAATGTQPSVPTSSAAVATPTPDGKAVDSKIRRVTIYSDRARVTRSGDCGIIPPYKGSNARAMLAAFIAARR